MPEDFDSTFRRYGGLIRTIAREFFAPGMSEDDMLQEANFAFWLAWRSYDQDAGKNFRGYAVMVMRRRLSSAVKAALRDKRVAPHGTISLDSTFDEDGLSVAELVGDERLDEQREALVTLRDLPLHRLTEFQRAVAEGRLRGDTYGEIAAQLGVNVKAVDNAFQKLGQHLRADQHRKDRLVEEGVLLVDRSLNPTERDAIRAARVVRPGCEVLALHKRKVRDGRVVSTRGRAKADGSLGRPVWAVELRA